MAQAWHRRAGGSIRIRFHLGPSGPLRRSAFRDQFRSHHHRLAKPGADTIIIAALVNTLPYSVVAAKGITTWNQLKGKKVGISRFGSGTDTAMRLVVKHGLDPVKDLVILQGGSSLSGLQAVTAGCLDATLLLPPWT